MPDLDQNDHQGTTQAAKSLAAIALSVRHFEVDGDVSRTQSKHSSFAAQYVPLTSSLSVRRSTRALSTNIQHKQSGLESSLNCLTRDPLSVHTDTKGDARTIIASGVAGARCHSKQHEG